MDSYRYEPAAIELELKNSRRIVEKSMELSRKYAYVSENHDDRFNELLEKLRNEEYLKNSFEKGLQETLWALKDSQKKNIDYERRISYLENILETGSTDKIQKLNYRIQELERDLIQKDQEIFSLKRYNDTRRSLNSNTLENTEKINKKNLDSQRINQLHGRIIRLERQVKQQSRSQKLLSSKTSKSQVKYNNK